MKIWWLIFLTTAEGLTKVRRSLVTVRNLLYEREGVKCFTDLPFGIINLPSSYERLRIQQYRLRACNWYLVQRARDGRVFDQLVEWLPVGILELGLNRLIEKARGMTSPELPQRFHIPESTMTREDVLSAINQLAEGRKEDLEQELKGILQRWHRGRPSELALYFSTYLLMYKLMRISEVVDLQHAPCIITLEDDAVNALTFLHPQRLRDLCLHSFSIDAWQLMWYRREHDYRDAAAKSPRCYGEDGVLDYDKQYFAAHGVMWRTLGLPKQLEVIAFDDEENEEGPWLNCTHHECVTDAFMKSVTNVKIPVTPWIGNPIMDHSTGLHSDKFVNHQFSVRAMSASFFTYEWASLGVASAVNSSEIISFQELRQSQLVRAEALKQFHRSPNTLLGKDVSTMQGRWGFDMPFPAKKATQ